MGEQRVSGRLGRLALAAALAFWCSCNSEIRTLDDGDPDTETETESDTDVACEPEGECDCVDGDYQECVDGHWQILAECPLECYPPMGCVVCVPGATSCEGSVMYQCDAFGEAVEEVVDCADFGVECEGGGCAFENPCDEANAFRSNIGCEYWAADLDNSQNAIDVAAEGQFAVAVANIGSNGTAHVEVHINDAPVGDPIDLELVEARDIEESAMYVFLLPRRDVDGGDFTDAHIDDGPQTRLSSDAFRIVSDVPVVAYQFNTLNQVYSNDASLLLPSSGIGKDYLVLGYPPHMPVSDLPNSPRNRGYVTILGTQDGTEVEVTAAAAIAAGEGIDEITQGGTCSFAIGAFDVINLETKLYPFLEWNAGAVTDLTGTRITSSKPVVVFFGTDLSMVVSEPGSGSCCAEHLEQQVIPSEGMGQEFVVTRSPQRSTGAPEPDLYRVIAYDACTVVTNLPAPDDTFALAAGEYREISSTTGFTVTTEDGHLHVAQYLVVGTDCIPAYGDSSLLYVPALQQRRGLYVFTTGQGFSRNAAVVSMPEGIDAMIDDTPVQTLCDGPHEDGEIGGQGYVSYVCEISDGVHMVYSGATPDESTAPIGVLVYGYYDAGSYAYPAGSDVRHINPAVIE